MEAINRRNFLEFSAAAAFAAMTKPLAAAAQAGDSQRMRLGMIVHVDQEPEAALQKVHELGLPTAQVGVEDYSDAMFTRLTTAVKKFDIEVTALNTSGGGPAVWDFYQGPETIGLVPRKYRAARIEHIKRASDFAKRAGFPAIHTHFGFIPENPNDPLYSEVVKAIREVVAHIKSNGQFVLYETGQESPVTMLRCITDVGLDNQFVNLDTANLILYGKGNPVDALDVVGKLVRGMHAKDGLFPTNPKALGEEVPIGHGRVDFPTLFKRLRELDYRGPVTIEREISGPQQLEDVRKEKLYLEKLIA